MKRMFLHLTKWTPVVTLPLLLLYACGDTGKKTNAGQTAHKAAKADSARAAIVLDSLPTEQYVAEIIRRRETALRQLPAMGQDAAAAAYRSLAQYMDTALAGIFQNEAKWLDTYVNYYSEEKHKTLPPPEVQARVNLLATAGIEPWYIGEGYTELRVVPDYLLKLFQQYLPADYRQYLRIRADEDSVLYSADGGILVPVHDIGLRVLNWEKFLRDYPASIFTANAREEYKFYLTDYLFGEDNTPSFENHNDLSTLLPEYKAEYIAYAEKHKDTRSGSVVKLFLDNVEKVNSMDLFRDMIRNAIEQALDPAVTILPVQPEFREEQAERLTKPVYDTVPGEVEIAEGTNEKIDRTLDTLLYFAQQNQTYCLAVYKNQGSQGSAPVSGWVDVWVFKKVHDQWQIADYKLEAGGGGMYGNSGYFEKVLAMGANCTGIVVNGGITHMGTSASWDDVLTFANDKLTPAFHLVTMDGYDGGMGASRCSSNKWYMETGNNKEAFDLVIVPSSCLGQNIPLEKLVISAKDGRYEVPSRFRDTGI